jgi:hypothetical protein
VGEENRMAKLKTPVLLLVLLVAVMTISVAYANPLVETLRPDQDAHAGMYIEGGSGSNHYDKVNEETADGEIIRIGRSHAKSWLRSSGTRKKAAWPAVE